MRPYQTEFVRYFLASALALVLDLAVFSGLLRIGGVPWGYAATVGFIVGAVTAYRLSVRFVFTQRRLAQSPAAEFMSFAAIGVAGLGVTQLVLWVGIEWLGANPELSKLAAAGVSFCLNFAARKLLLFHLPSAI